RRQHSAGDGSRRETQGCVVQGSEVQGSFLVLGSGLQVLRSRCQVLDPLADPYVPLSTGGALWCRRWCDRRAWRVLRSPRRRTTSVNLSFKTDFADASLRRAWCASGGKFGG